MINIYDIWFARVDVANSIKKQLYKKFLAKELFYFDKEKFLKIGLKEKTINKFLDEKYKTNLDKYLEYMNKNSIVQIFYNDKKYPSKLRTILDAPTYIFAKRKYRIIRRRQCWNYWL